LVDRFGERTASQAIYFQIEVDSGAANGSMDTPTIVLPRIRSRGTAFALTAASADALKGVTATAAEMNRLAGVTANVQSQINTLAAGGSSVSKVDKTGDSMSGALDVGANITSTGTLTGATLNSTGVTASRFALFDSSKNLTSSASSVTDTEFGFLSGVTANLGTNLNGLTANVQTQLNAKQAALGYSPVSKLGDSMSGALQVGAAITSTGTVTAATLNATGLTASRALAVDASKNLVSSSVTDSELGYLSGATSNIQSQLNLKASGTFDGFSTLTDAATIAVDGSLGRIYKVTLGGDRTMGNPTNLVTGRMYTFVVGQDATGGRILSWGTSYKGTIPAVGSSSLVSAASGTVIGDLTSAGGNAAAFDGVTSQAALSGARTGTVSTGYVGKDWGSGVTKTISRFRVWGPSDSGIFSGADFTATLEGSSDGSSWTTLYTSGTEVSSNSGGYTLDVTSGITAASYRYHRVRFDRSGSNNLQVAEVSFYESAILPNTTAVYPFVSDGTYLYYAVDPGPSGSGGNAVTSYTASRAIASDSSGNAVASSVTSTELGYLAGVTSNIQTQINSVSGGGSLLRASSIAATAIALPTSGSLSGTYLHLGSVTSTGAYTVASGTRIYIKGNLNIGHNFTLSGVTVGGQSTNSGSYGNAQSGGGPAGGQVAEGYTAGAGGGGGGFGGEGGHGGSSLDSGWGWGGRVLGWENAWMGSGGGSGQVYSTGDNPGDGGNAGGVVYIESTGNVTITGSSTMSANGSPGIAATSGGSAYVGGGGGGSGGGIMIRAGGTITITSGSSITANGGAGGNGYTYGGGGGGGGGGVVALWGGGAVTNSGTISISGGAKGNGGGSHAAEATAGLTGVTSLISNTTPISFY